MTAAGFTSPWLRYAHGRSIMMPFSTRFLQGVPGSSDCINPCAENIIAGETDPAAPVPSEPDLPRSPIDAIDQEFPAHRAMLLRSPRWETLRHTVNEHGATGRA